MSQTEPDLRRTRTLIVEEDSRVRRVLRRTLEEWNAEVTEAENGARGLVALKHARDSRKPFELILVAARMSGMDGFELCELLHAHPAELASTILMLGPNHRGSHIIRAGKLGVSGYVAKPLSGNELYRAVSEIIRPVGGPPVAEPAEGGAPVPDGRIRILVAEDSPDTRSLIRYFLDDPGYQIDLAENGGIAVDLYRLGEYDLVLMDIQMPVFDGYQATEQIHEWGKKQGRPHVPIVAITAYTKTEDPQKSLRAGFDGYLAKPLEKEALVSVVKRFVKRSPSRDEQAADT